VVWHLKLAYKNQLWRSKMISAFIWIRFGDLAAEDKNSKVAKEIFETNGRVWQLQELKAL